MATSRFFSEVRSFKVTWWPSMQFQLAYKLWKAPMNTYWIFQLATKRFSDICKKKPEEVSKHPSPARRGLMRADFVNPTRNACLNRTPRFLAIWLSRTMSPRKRRGRGHAVTMLTGTTKMGSATSVYVFQQWQKKNKRRETSLFYIYYQYYQWAMSTLFCFCFVFSWHQNFGIVSVLYIPHALVEYGGTTRWQGSESGSSFVWILE